MMSSGKQQDGGAKRPKVLAGDWEDALRAGQQAEGLSGSVEPELSIVHLLRHARAPEGIDDDRLDAVWTAVDAAVGQPTETPWWRRPWTWIGGTAVAAAAAAAVLVIVLPGEPGPQPGTPLVAQGDDGGAPPPVADHAAALERQFQILAPAARERVAASVDDDRGQLRDALLAQALKADEAGSMGGAP